MEHDFFTKQPIIDICANTTGIHLLTSLDARAYYMRFCLHEWLIPKAHHILAILRNSLTKGCSKILIDESAVPDQRAQTHRLSTSPDMVMMVHFFRKRTHRAESAYAAGTD